MWLKKLQLNTLIMDLFLTDMQVFTSQDNKWWNGVVWIVMFFISCLDSHSDGTHLLQRMHFWASDVMLNLSKSVPMNNHLIYILDGLRERKYSANFIFG